jgi:hypothetical protein
MGLGSGIREKTYSGSRIRVQCKKGTGSRIRNTECDLSCMHLILCSAIIYPTPEFIVIRDEGKIEQKILLMVRARTKFFYVSKCCVSVQCSGSVSLWVPGSGSLHHQAKIE